MSDIERLRVVATVARTHSISDAARAHGVAQSTVTRSVTAAEQLVGFPLFQRTTTGARVAVGAQPAIALIERIVKGFDELRTLAAQRPSTLRVAHRADLSIPARVEDAMARWNRDNTPAAELGSVADPVAAVRAGKADCALVLRTARSPIEGLERIVVWATRLERIELLHRPDPPAELATFVWRI